MSILINFKSIYSSLKSTISIEDMMLFSVNNNFKYLLLADYYSMAGMVNFYYLSKKHNIHPLIGFSGTLLFRRNYYHISIFCINNTGLSNVILFMNNLNLVEDKNDYFLINNIKKYLRKNVYFLIHYHNNIRGLKKICKFFIKNNYKVFLEYDYTLSKSKQDKIKRIAKLIKIKLLPSRCIYCLHKNDIQQLDILTAIKNNTTLNNLHNFKLDYTLNSHAEYNIEDLDNELSLNLQEIVIDKIDLDKFYDVKVKKVPILYENATEAILYKVKKFIDQYLYDNNITNLKDVYYQRIYYELDVITKMQFEHYFLIVEDIVKWCINNHIPVTCRGSGVGSLIIFALQITNIDPIKHNLIFERFLNIDRMNWPDIDIDVCKYKRNLIIQYLKTIYTKNNTTVANISAFAKMKFKSAFKDVARIITNFKFQTINDICKNFDSQETLEIYIKQKYDLINKYHADSNITIGDIEQNFYEFLSKNYYSKNLEDILNSISDQITYIKQILDISSKLSNCIRGTSIHASGIIISNSDLINKVPLTLNKEGVNCIATQLEMHDMEKIGYVKFDILGSKTLTLLYSVASKNNIDFFTLQENKICHDQKIFCLLGLGYSKGIFQLEKDLSSTFLQKMQPSCFEDIIALISLNRPGPMAYIDHYILCKQGKEKITYIHNSLKEVLHSTYGIIIFQEQIMTISKIVANYSMTEADNLRRVISKKLSNEMMHESEKFIRKAVENNFKMEVATSIFHLIEKFANYGFNKSHAVSYARLSMIAAYLKSRYIYDFIALSVFYDLNDTGKICEFFLDLILLTKCIFIIPIIGISKHLLSYYCAGVYILPINIIKGINENLINFSHNYNFPIYDAAEFIRQFQDSGTKDSLKKLILLGIIREKVLGEHLDPVFTIDNFNHVYKELEKINIFGKYLFTNTDNQHNTVDIESYIRKSLTYEKYFNNNFYELMGFSINKVNLFSIIYLLFGNRFTKHIYFFKSIRSYIDKSFTNYKVLTLINTFNIAKNFRIYHEDYSKEQIDLLNQLKTNDLVFMYINYMKKLIKVCNITALIYKDSNIPILSMYDTISIFNSEIPIIQFINNYIHINLKFRTINEFIEFVYNLYRKVNNCFISDNDCVELIRVIIDCEILEINNICVDDLPGSNYLLYNIIFNKIDLTEYYLLFYKYLYSYDKKK